MINIDEIKIKGFIPQNTVINADCLEAMKYIPDKSIDMILCDLPYGKTNCSWDIVIPFRSHYKFRKKIFDDMLSIEDMCENDIEDFYNILRDKRLIKNEKWSDIEEELKEGFSPVGLWDLYERIIKDNGAIILTATQPFTSALVMSNLKMFKYDLIWNKNHPKGHLNAKKMPMRSHEEICIFYKKLPVYNPQKTTKHKRKVAKVNYIKEQDGNSIYGREIRNTSYDSTERYPLSVQSFSNSNQSNKLHPTQKPVALFEYLIKTYTNEGNLVLDNCAGSFTTSIACDNLKRNWICIEKEEKYCNIGLERINNNKKD